ncbi:hypothetical protein VTN77DRAFT_9905 [Rasamsonia byssochlamydoides]|uniref:uncharacterized protein n=1 Tax=Rasamsonia byssochlamydoides TaxID=89139 RepID=UPI003742B4E6
MTAASETQQAFVNAAGGIATDDDFSVYEETARSDTTSLASSVLNYQYENGRRYHAYSQERKYMMPNDDTEQDRLDLVHHIFSLILDGELFVAPVKQPQAILDLGTGTGIWAIDVADKFPSARVIGNDLSAIQPSWVPPNVEFVIDDFEKDWMYDENYFDFIHARTLAGSVQDWPWLMRQAYNHLKPNGYFEVADVTMWGWSDDGSLKDDSPYIQYLKNLHKAGEKIGRDVNIATKLKHWVEEAGFEDVVEKVYILPLGPWPKDPKLKELGKWTYIQFPDAIDAYGLRLYTQVLGWDANEAKIHHALVKQQLRDRSLHAYSKIYVVYGRKPEPKPTA